MLGILWFRSGCLGSNEMNLKWDADLGASPVVWKCRWLVTRKLCSAKKL